MAVSDENPTGIRPFNHQDLAQLVEYHELRAALDKLVHAIAEDQREGSTLVLAQADFLELARDAAASTAFADNCQACDRSRPDVDPITYPAFADVDGEGLVAGYVCPRCEARWTSWWALGAPEMI